MIETAAAQSILNIGSAKLKQTPNVDAVLSIDIIVREYSDVQKASLESAFDNLKSLYAGCSACKLNIEQQVRYRRAEHNTNSSRMSSDLFCSKFKVIDSNLDCGQELDIIRITLHAAKQTN